MSVWTIDVVISQRDVSKALALMVYRYSESASALNQSFSRSGPVTVLAVLLHAGNPKRLAVAMST
jgi:hypothetical protein